MTVDPRTSTTIALAERYLEIIERQPPHTGAQDSRLNHENLAWICREMIKDGHALPLDKISRWLGFVQGCLAMQGLIQVDEERDVSRPLFHAAYRETGILPPKPREKRD